MDYIPDPKYWDGTDFRFARLTFNERHEAIARTAASRAMKAGDQAAIEYLRGKLEKEKNSTTSIWIETLLEGYTEEVQ